MKKLSHILVIFVLLFNQIFGYDLFIVQASSLDNYYLKSSLDTTPSFLNPTDNLSLLPWQWFRLEWYVKNSTWWPLNNISFYWNFPSWIIYSWSTTAASQVDGWSTYVIPTSSFNPPTNSNYLNWLATLNNNSIFQMRRILLSFPENWSIYNNSISTYFTSWWPLTSNTLYSTFFVNVKPHITDYYFEKADESQTTSQIQWWNAESINFVVKVKDYNGCSNIDNWAITANLSQLGLSSNESLNYVSCNSDGKTAIFKKTWITTLASLGSYTFDYTLFSAKDEDNNVIDPNDPNTTFDNEDKKTSISLSVVSAWAPVLSKTIPSNLFVWPNQTSSSFNVSSDKDWQYSVAVWSDWSCNWGTTIIPWTWTWYIANTSIPVSLSQSQLSEWTNKIYFCFKNLTDELGSDYVEITKDSNNPTISNIIASPSSIVTNDPTISFICSENWWYTVNPGWYSSSSIIANQTNSQVIANSNFSEWTNNIVITCKDNANNSVVWNATVTKSTAPPSMSGAVLSFADTDINQDWLDGSDLNISWDNTVPASYAYFESYRLYLLPSSVTFDKNTQTYINLLPDKNLSSWIWDSSITKDSTNTSLVNGGGYKMCVAIMATSGQLWEVWCSPISTLITDYPEHPTILSAKFTSDTNLELTTDTTLNTSTWSHSWGLVSFQIGWVSYTWVTVPSVNAKKLNIIIPSLGNLASTWSNLIALTWAINAFSGWYNNYFTSWSLVITDWQTPTITSFINNTVSPYNWFYKWIINLSYILWETLKAWWTTYIKFSRTAWNPGTDVIFPITDTTKLTWWSKSLDLNLDSLWLVSGTTYDVQIIGTDIASNPGNSNIISWLKYDKTGPSMMSILPVWIVGIINPTLNWLTTVDDYGNWAWIKNYILNVYTGSTCSGTYTQNVISSPLTLSLQISLANLNNYAWNITPVDNLNNTGSVSWCDSFTINTFLPVFSNYSIKDTVLNSTSYSKWWNNIEITSKIDNTDISHIWMDASSLKDSTYSNISCAAPWISWVSCSYNSWIAKYIFSSWFSVWLSSWVKQAKFTSTNTAWINTWTVLTSITLDNSIPVISWSPITSPTSWSIFGWTSKNITWTTSAITDNIAIAYLKFEYSPDWWTSWTTIWTWANSSPYTWNIWAITDGNNYKIKITAFDQVGNNISTTSNTFTIDKTSPSIWAINLNLDKNIYKWWQTAIVTWNNTLITDSNLWTNPITLSYSLDNWVNWTAINSNLANNGSANWLIPASYNSNQVKIKLSATDLAGNSWSIIGANTYIVDNTLPVMWVTFAWGGGNTPQNGKYINNSWIDTTTNATDSYLDKVYYSLQNLSDTTYWNNSWNGWLAMGSWNQICADWVILWTDSTCSNLSSILNFSWIADGSNYRLVFKAVDEAGNEKQYNPIDYIGDTIAPTLNITTANGVYFSWTINITGTASDARSGLSSVNIEIKKWASWWNGTSWVGSQVLLAISWTPASWNYNFSAPINDNDWQNYSVIVNAFDNTFKTNNESTSTISIILDKSWPVVASDIFTLDTTGIKKWWTILPITWTPTKITSTWSNINHIKLSYNSGTWTITDIVDNYNNSWSYNFSIPIIDTTCMKIIIEASDNVGNISNQVNSNCIVVDSLPPTITKVETQDYDANWQLDGLLVTFSEIINHSSINITDFTISNSITLSWNYIVNDAASETTIQLKFNSNYWDTSSTPTISYNWTSIEDITTNKLAIFSNKISIDKAIPRILKTEILDSNSNGKLDLLKVYFSENIAATSDIASYTLNNILPWISIASASVTWSISSIVLNEWTNYNTSPWVMDITFNNNGNWKDIANNQAWNVSNSNLIDKASPILVSALTFWNKQVDEVKLTFSENLAWTMIWFTLNWFVPNAYTWIIIQSINILSLKINNTLVNTDQTWSLSYTGNISDWVGNSVALINNYIIQDKVEPRILSVETLDTNNNGKIDSLLIKTTENLNSNISWLNYGVSWYNTNWITINWKNFQVWVDEKSIEDTSATPAFQITSNTIFGDLAFNNISDFASKTSQDKVGPVITWARFVGNTVYITASENLTWTLDSSNFVLSWSLGTFQNVNYTWNQITLTLNVSPGSTADISFASWSTTDNYNNKQTWNKFVRISSSVVINEVMYSTGNTQYIELKNLWTSSVDLTSWKIKNGWWDWIDIIIPNWKSISSWWLFLIAKNWITTLSWVITDFSGALNLDTVSQNNLILEDASANVWDKAITSPYPAWNSNSWIAMERKTSPGDWLISTNWYSSVVNNWLSTWYYGTPWNTNVFDAIAPVITSQINNNTLYPLGNVNIIFDYSDNIELNTNTVLFSLKNWSGTDITNTAISSSWITANEANYQTSNLLYGKYSAELSISDTSGNSTTKTIVFYVDQVSMNISAWAVDMWTIKSDWSIYFANDTIVTIKTVGAGFNLVLGWSGTMSWPGGWMWAYDGNYWYWFDYARNENWTILYYSNNLSVINDNIIWSNTYNSWTIDWTLRTYTYTIKHWAKINSLQTAWNYNATSKFSINLDY